MRTSTHNTMADAVRATPCWLWRVKDQVVSVVILVSFASMLLAPIHGYAEEAESNGTEENVTEAGLGLASFLMTIPYSVAKIVYAGLGTIVGGFTYVLTGGSKETADAVWIPSWRGTYVITPDHLKGKKAIRFVGLPPEFEEHE